METQYRIRIEQDPDAESPREWENLGTMVCWHGRYQLGDEQPSCDPQEWKLRLAEEFEPGIEERIERFADRLWPRLSHLDVDTKLRNHARDVAAYQDDKVDEILDRHVIMLPLYLYDHGSVTMNTGGFHCPWDSAQVGWIWVSRASARETHGWSRITAKRQKQIEQILKAEVAVYAQFLEGDVHGFVIERVDEDGDWDIEDSCWGFYGSDPFENGMADHINAQHHELLKEVA